METEKMTISEQWFRQFWQYQVLDGRSLRTESGEPIRVLYPGRPNDLRGPDFRDAVIETGTGRRHGDIEIHLRSGDWRNHRHHLDRHYNRVILHVVMRHTTKRGTVLQNGEEIPVLTMNDPIAQSGRQKQFRQQYSVPCTISDITRLLYCLDEAGYERFHRKAAAVTERIKTDGETETLYREMMESMGYAANKEPFRELAERVPLSKIARIEHDDQDRDTAIRARLFGSAGFLRDEFQPRLAAAGIDEHRYRTLKGYWQRTGGKIQVPTDRWQLFRIRPNNSPFVRLAIMSTILNHTGVNGFLLYMKSVIAAGVEITDTNVIEDDLIALSVTSGNKTGNGTVISLGRERARAIVVNVLLPFAYAVSCFERDQILETYRNCRKASENSLERHMREQFGLEKRDITTAAQQQGLIHIYKTRCTQGRCDECDIRISS